MVLHELDNPQLFGGTAPFTVLCKSNRYSITKDLPLPSSEGVDNELVPKLWLNQQRESEDKDVKWKTNSEKKRLVLNVEDMHLSIQASVKIQLYFLLNIVISMDFSS